MFCNAFFFGGGGGREIAIKKQGRGGGLKLDRSGDRNRGIFYDQVFYIK